nr:DUF4314 domain-containing protein [uncultured Tyzzerella sp.]
MDNNIKNKDNDYIKFAKMYLEKAIIDSIRKKTQNDEITIDSELKNEFGNTIYLRKEITDFINVLGDELIKDFDNITNKIDEYFFTYKYKTLIEQEKVEDIKVNTEQEKVEDIQANIEQERVEDTLANKLKNEIDNTEEKIIYKINVANIEEDKKFSLKKITEDLFKNLKDKILKVLGTELEMKNTLDNEIKYELLKSENLSSKMLESLSNDKDVSILRKVAMHQNTDEKTLEKIFKNTKDFKVMENLLKNENTPTKIIDELSKNDDKDIALLAFGNKNISQDLLVKHSKSKDLDVINSILNNENLPEKALENIINSNFKDTEILKKISDIIDKNFGNEIIVDKDSLEKIKELKNEYPQGTLLRLENIDNGDIPVGTMAFVDNIDDNGKLNVICSNGNKINIDLNKDSFKKIEMKNLSITQQFSIDNLRQKLFKNNDMKEKLEHKITKNNTMKL